MVCVTGGAIRSVEFVRRAVISAPLRGRIREALWAKLRPSQAEPFWAQAKAPAVPQEYPRFLRLDSAAAREYKPRCTNGREVESVTHSLASHQSRWSSHRRKSTGRPAAADPGDRWVGADIRAAQSFRCRRRYVSDREHNKY